MPKVTKIINGEYIGGEKYTITDAGEGKSIISFSPDTVLEEGTPVGAEILNEMQKNGVYSLIGTRNISGQKEIYTCSIEGIVDFGLFDIILIMTPDTTNTTQNVFIDLSGTEFQIVSYSGNIFIGELSLNIPYIFKLNANNKKAFLIGSERLSKGNYNKTAADLKNEIDTKLNKSTYNGDAATLKADIDTRLPKGTYPGNADELYQFTGRTYTRMMYILGQHDGDFPLSSAKKDTVWFLESNNRHYICTKDYNGPQISVPNENFEDLSVYTNRLKINGLQAPSVEVASETFFWDSGEGWSIYITLKRFAKNGVITKETISINKPAENGTINAKLYTIPIPSSATFPAKYWGAPIGIGTDDPGLSYRQSSIAYDPGIITIEFEKPVYGGSTFLITYTWLYDI